MAKKPATLDDVLGEIRTNRLLLEGLYLRLDKAAADERAQEKRFMKSVQQYSTEINTELDELTESTKKISNVADSAVTAFTGVGNVIAGLKQQIADLIAAGGTVDTSSLEGLRDKADAAQQALEAKAATLAAAILESTNNQ